MPVNADIDEVVEVPDGREAALGADFTREYTRRFRVRTLDERVGALRVAFAPGVPRWFDPYIAFGETEGDFLSRCRRIRPRQDPDDPTLWWVECEYSTAVARSDGQASLGGPGTAGGSPPQGGGTMDRPELRLPVVSWGFEETRKPFRKTLDGKPVVNSAKDRFSPLPEVEVFHPVLTVERFELSYDADRAWEYTGAVNRSFFIMVNRGHCICRGITGTTEQIGNHLYWKVRYVFRFHKTDQESEEILDDGLRRKKTNGDRVRIRDPESQNEVSDPVPLNGQGQPLVFDPNRPEDEQLYYAILLKRPTKDFDALQLV